MYIQDFKLEKWLNPKDESAKYNLGASCVKALTVSELFDLLGQDVEEFLNSLKGTSLHYGHFFGLDRLLHAISKLYRNIEPKMILTVHGGTGANNLVMTELIDRNDNVIAMVPSYQQHYSIPESLGAEVRYLELKEENGYLPDLSELDKLVDGNTKMITLSNPNNPTGAFINEALLTEISKIASRVGAYILCDEIYRGMDDKYMASIVDVYERGIVTSSMSKVFSMAGTRVGWIVTRDKDTYERLENRRSYDTICGGVFDELISAIALEQYEKILDRSRSIVREGQNIFDNWILTQPRLSVNYKSLGTTVFVKYDYHISSIDLCTDILEKTGVLLCHGDCFNVPYTFRVGYAFGKNDILRDGLHILGNYISELK